MSEDTIVKVRIVSPEDDEWREHWERMIRAVRAWYEPDRDYIDIKIVPPEQFEQCHVAVISTTSEDCAEQFRSKCVHLIYRDGANVDNYNHVCRKFGDLILEISDIWFSWDEDEQNESSMPEPVTSE